MGTPPMGSQAHSPAPGQAVLEQSPAGVSMDDWDDLLAAVKERLAGSVQEHPHAACLMECAAALGQLHASLARARNRPG